MKQVRIEIHEEDTEVFSDFELDDTILTLLGAMTELSKKSEYFGSMDKKKLAGMLYKVIKGEDYQDD